MSDEQGDAPARPMTDAPLSLPIGISSDYVEKMLVPMPEMPVVQHQNGKLVDYSECRHDRGVIVDVDARTVTCRGCNGPVDPLRVLGRFAKEWARVEASVGHRRREAGQIVDEIEVLKKQRAKLQREIAKEIERTEKLGLAVHGEKTPRRTKRWRMSDDRIMSVDRVAAGVEFIREHGGGVRLHAADGSVVAFLVHPSLRFVVQ